MYSKHFEHMDKLVKALENDGAFLVVENKLGKANLMTIGWATVGMVWGKPMMTVFVRPVRYTYELIENATSFSVCVPALGKLKEELILCGTSSGRSIDKVKATGLTLKKGLSKDSLVVEECKYFYECNIVQKNMIDQKTLDAGIIKSYYPHPDFHAVYYGEIKHSYARD